MNLRKLSIIIKREYITRIRKKSFILTTILIPIGLAALIIAPIAIQMMDSDTVHKIAIADQTGIVYEELAELDTLRYKNYENTRSEVLRQKIIDEEIEGFITITEEHIYENKPIQLIYSGGGGITLTNSIESDLQTVLQKIRLSKANASNEIMTILETETKINARKLTAEGEEKRAHTMFLSGLGYLMAFIVYGTIFGYGGFVMRSVIEEKSSRIIEVVVSSAKPFELLLGKIMGIGALGLTQFLIWVLAGAGILSMAAPLSVMVWDKIGVSSAETAATMPEIPEIDLSIGLYFILFFLLGYLIYSAILAAIGSAVDSETDTQQLMIPIMVPVIIAIIILPRVASDPDSTFSVISSLIPLFSPILMIARIPITDVPMWEIITSIGLMIGTFLGMLWLSAKIYSVGILSYGKSAGFRELLKWIRQD